MPTVDELSAGHRKETDPEIADRCVPTERSLSMSYVISWSDL